MSPSFFVLGHNGMLGSVVLRYLEEQGYDCLTSPLRYEGNPRDPLIDEVVSSRADVAINCAGITTQRGITDHRLFVANALLPQHLAAALEPERLLIHASTDCVFDGSRGQYLVDSAPDAVDPYGLSKRLGELAVRVPRARVVVLRTSIVGPEIGSARGLLGWFLSQTGAVHGWQDHLWNGITTLAWAILSLEVAAGRRHLASGIHQPCTEQAVSKYELLQLFADEFDHRVPIAAVKTGAPIDHTLVPTIRMSPLTVQLGELHTWWRRQVGA